MFDEIKDLNKRAFLNAYVDCGGIAKASTLAGNSRNCIWYWKRDDDEFDKAFTVATEIYQGNYLSELEQILKERANDPKAPMSTVALFFALKAEAPDKYREKSLIDKAIIGDITVKLAIPPYDEKMRLTHSTSSEQAEGGDNEHQGRDNEVTIEGQVTEVPEEEDRDG